MKTHRFLVKFDTKGEWSTVGDFRTWADAEQWITDKIDKLIEGRGGIFDVEVEQRSVRAWADRFEIIDTLENF